MRPLTLILTIEVRQSTFHTWRVKKEELRELLREYGEHKWGCGISKALRGEWPIDRPRKKGEYPRCDCGWEDVRHIALRE
jgi:hypothetical protein